jgi:hypothetical protein
MSSEQGYDLTKAHIQQLLEFPFTASENEWMIRLEQRIHELIATDFGKLLDILYRLDVDEEKVHAVLKQNPSVDAGRLIASLIMERQMEKMESRDRYSQGNTHIDEDGRW